MIEDFIYGRGDIGLPGKRGRPPVVQGRPVAHLHEPGRHDRDRRPQASAYHTITACKAPCTAHDRHRLSARRRARSSSTRASSASGRAGFTPAANRNTWQTPKNLKAGHLHVLLPDPPVHARRVPGRQELGGTAPRLPLQERRSAAPGRTCGFSRFHRPGRSAARIAREIPRASVVQGASAHEAAGRNHYQREGTVRRSLIGAVVSLAAALMLAPAASAVDEVNTKQLRKGVTAAGILEHMRAFQRIANANGGTRAATTPATTRRSTTSSSRMTRAGYKVTRDRSTSRSGSRPDRRLLQRERPGALHRGHCRGHGDYVVAQFSGAGNVTAPVVDDQRHRVPPPGGPGTRYERLRARRTGRGIDLAGKIALIQRGDLPVRGEDRRSPRRSAPRRC